MTPLIFCQGSPVWTQVTNFGRNPSIAAISPTRELASALFLQRGEVLGLGHPLRDQLGCRLWRLRMAVGMTSGIGRMFVLAGSSERIRHLIWVLGWQQRELRLRRRKLRRHKPTHLEDRLTHRLRRHSTGPMRKSFGSVCLILEVALGRPKQGTVLKNDETWQTPPVVSDMSRRLKLAALLLGESTRCASPNCVVSVCLMLFCFNGLCLTDFFKAVYFQIDDVAIMAVVLFASASKWHLLRIVQKCQIGVLVVFDGYYDGTIGA